MLTPPTRALVLAAGLGTRLRPFTWHTPKPLLPVHGGPPLAHTLRHLQDWGVREAVINAHWHAGLIQDFARQWPGPMRLHVSLEPDALGTGGALRPLRPFFHNEPFWIVNADILFTIDPAPLWQRFDPATHIASLWLYARGGPRTVLTRPDHTIATFRAPRRSPGGATFSGVHLANPRVFDFLPASDPCSIVTAYETAAAHGLATLGLRLPKSSWCDIGTLPAYHRLQRANPAPPVAEPSPLPRRVCKALGWKPAQTEIRHLGHRRGSDREFWRIANPAAAAIVISHAGARAENRRYAPLTRALVAKGAPVPRLLFAEENDTGGLLALEDLGSMSLQMCAAATRDFTALYTPVMDAVRKFHAASPTLSVEFEPGFDESLYLGEQNLFKTHLGGFTPAVRAEYARVTARLLATPQTVIHRDLQSSNIHRHNGAWHFIDYQGMRPGAIVYDLASLLYDPYVALPPGVRAPLLRHYARTLAPAIARRLRADLPWAAVQRLTQACGAYGRLATLGHTDFQRHLPPALQRLRQAAETCGLTALAAMASSRPGAAHGLH